MIIGIQSRYCTRSVRDMVSGVFFLSRIFFRTIGLSGRIVDAIAQKSMYITTLESCTLGMLCALLGASGRGIGRILRESFILYSNQAKSKFLELYSGDDHLNAGDGYVYSHELVKTLATIVLKTGVSENIAIVTSGILTTSFDTTYNKGRAGDLYIGIGIRANGDIACVESEKFDLNLTDHLWKNLLIAVYVAMVYLEFFISHCEDIIKQKDMQAHRQSMRVMLWKKKLIREKQS